ncbi:MAG: UDP-N-acetylmuramoyl-L-alanyl-D-glutamate--2,6-diaminopimelate ligase [Micavibrio sp.]|nr:UDP-N-acetylmuramoyl-L-alanyl-D-glutamate--2,6-diaminopimelate ligase [Micavibrio sp.]
MQLTNLVDTDKDVLIKGITSDSRLVKAGYLFAAMPGSKEDGTKYIADAINHGAVALLVHDKVALPEIPEHVTVIKTENTRKSFASIAKKFYKLQPDNIVAVTGTSGKTSTVSFTQQLWHLAGITNCASLGTLGVSGPGIKRYGRLTTPDTESLHAELADLSAVGITHLAMEASSHGLDQYRLDGVHVDAAAYTNLSRDHLDYHKDMNGYFEAKSRLFSELLDIEGTAVINKDDEYADRLVEICKDRGVRTITFGHSGDDIKLISRLPKPSGQKIEISVSGKEYSLTLPLVGDFQVMNALCALGLVLASDNDPGKYVPLLQKLRGVPGRLQLVEGSQKGAVYVDYAHKPAALETVLKTLRPHTEGRLICLFGCGGDRDAGKRPMMGKIADDLSDVVVVTDDNPRSEDAALIRREILTACPDAKEIGDRADAIAWCVSHLQEGDVLLVAGKGHEEGQIIGGKVEPFNDVEEVEKSIKAQS